MSSSIPPTTSWRQRLSLERTKRYRNNDSRPTSSQGRMSTSNSITNRSRDENKETYKLAPLSSLISSRNSTNIHYSTLDRTSDNSVRQDGVALAVSAPMASSRVSATRQLGLHTHRSMAGATPTIHGGLPAEAVSSDVGSDLLEFGTSVEFHENHRRHVHSETREIEVSNEATQEAVAKETLVGRQLKKELDRTRSELASLYQGAGDQLDTTKMFSTLTKNLEGELRSRILEPTKPTLIIVDSIVPLVQSAAKRSSCTIHLDTLDRLKKESTSEGIGQHCSHQDVTIQKLSQTDELLQIIRNEAKAIDAAWNEVYGLKEKYNQMKKSIDLQGLEDSLMRVREEERRLESELQKAKNVKATRIVEIQQIRESHGAKAQKYADLMKHLAETKKSNDFKEAYLRKEYQTIIDDNDHLLKEKVVIMIQVNNEKQSLEKVEREIGDYHYYCKSKENHKNVKNFWKIKKDNLLFRIAEAKRKLHLAQEEALASLLRRHQAEGAMNLAEAKKKVNFEREANIILPGKVELTKLAKRKKKLTELTAQASKTIEQTKTKKQELLVSNKLVKEDAMKETNKLESQYNSLQEEVEASCKARREVTKSYNEDIVFHVALAKKFVDMNKNEREVGEVRFKNARERWSEELVCHVVEEERIAEANSCQAEVFDRAVVLLEEAERE